MIVEKADGNHWNLLLDGHHKSTIHQGPTHDWKFFRDNSALRKNNDTSFCL
jgi:hypothetical protein